MNSYNREKIHILDALTANQIAAGEVVENPGSVVKELVENSIDAGANRISVKVLDSQAESIQVSDNGRGMSPEDLSRAILRHATSKIKRVEDLSLLGTLGFRGEALPSIASVSDLSLSSCQKGENTGYRIEVKAGKACVPQEIAHPEGTTVTVENLFYNTPARKKFLKSPQRELSNLGEIMNKMALSHPEIAFSLTVNGKKQLNTSGSGNLSQAVMSVYGQDTLRKLVKVDWLENMLIYGMVSLPELSRANRSQYNFFVNNRWVRCKELAEAVDEVYHTLLPKNRYPLVILYLSLAPSLMDVNVHPAKLEVKFKDGQTIQKCLTGAIIKALSEKETIYAQLAKNEPKSPPLGGKDNFRLEQTATKKASQDKEYRIKDSAPGSLIQSFYRKPKENILGEVRKAVSYEKPAYPGLTFNDKPAPEEPGQKEEQAPEFLFASLRVMGQLSASFILAEGEEGLYIIDQHAAHERIQYERMKIKAEAQEALAQELAIPLTLELSPDEKGLLMEAILEFDNLGFKVEHFGDNSFILRSVPAWYEGSAPESLFYELLAMSERKKGKELKLPRHEELFLRACKSAVKANRYLTESDINKLLSDLDKCQNPSTCPHGRPTAVKITIEEIRRKFLRTSI